MLFALLDPKHSEQPEINCFWHMLMNFSPSVVRILEFSEG